MLTMEPGQDGEIYCNRQAGLEFVSEHRCELLGDESHLAADKDSLRRTQLLLTDAIC
jgi:hypothetical protein